MEIPGVACLVTGLGGLPRYEITTPHGEAHIYLHGAHVTHFAPAGQKRLLFMSRESRFEPGQAIRGGIPVIFPWFGPQTGSAAHGFARSRSWKPESLVQEPDGSVALAFQLQSDPEMQALWGEPHAWSLRYRIVVGTALTLELEIENRGAAPFQCEEMLHTYLQVSDVRQTEVRGLEGVEYIDKCDGGQRKRQGSEPIRFTEETDRTYLNTNGSCSIKDPAWNRQIVVEKTNSDSTVVWNPWIEKSKRMPDYGDHEWPSMVCVETGNVADNALEIAPGQTHLTRTVVRCEPL